MKLFIYYITYLVHDYTNFWYLFSPKVLIAVKKISEKCIKE